MSEPSNLDPSEVRLMLTIGNFQVAGTAGVDFDKTIGGTLDPDARKLLNVATSQRKLLMQGITNEGDAVDPRNITSSVDSYYPSLWRITRSMEESAGAQIKLTKPLEITWRSALGRSHAKFTCGVLVYEVANVLVTKALAHYGTAKLLASADEEGASPAHAECATELRIAAGVLNHVGNNILPRWVEPPAKKPVEVERSIIKGLAMFCLATAQRITIAKASETGTKHAVLARLYQGAVDMYISAGRLFRAADALYYAELVENVKDEVQAMSVLMRALAFKHLAQTRSLEGEIGAAVGYAHEASRLVHALKVPPAYAKWLEGVDAHVVAHIDRVYADLHAENANVYFAIVTPASEMDGPQGVAIMKPVDFGPPEMTTVSFASIKSKRDSKTPPTSPSGASSSSKSKSKSSKDKDKSKSSKDKSKDKSKRTSTSRRESSKPKPKEEVSAPVRPGNVSTDIWNAMPSDIQEELAREHASK